MKYSWSLAKARELVAHRRPGLNILPEYVDQLQQFEQRHARKKKVTLSRDWICAAAHQPDRCNPSEDKEDEHLVTNTYLNSLTSNFKPASFSLDSNLFKQQLRKNISWPIEATNKEQKRRLRWKSDTSCESQSGTHSHAEALTSSSKINHLTALKPILKAKLTPKRRQALAPAEEYIQQEQQQQQHTHLNVQGYWPEKLKIESGSVRGESAEEAPAMTTASDPSFSEGCMQEEKHHRRGKEEQQQQLLHCSQWQQQQPTWPSQVTQQQRPKPEKPHRPQICEQQHSHLQQPLPQLHNSVTQQLPLQQQQRQQSLQQQHQMQLPLQQQQNGQQQQQQQQAHTQQQTSSVTLDTQQSEQQTLQNTQQGVQAQQNAKKSSFLLQNSFDVKFPHTQQRLCEQQANRSASLSTDNSEKNSTTSMQAQGNTPLFMPTSQKATCFNQETPASGRNYPYFQLSRATTASSESFSRSTSFKGEAANSTNMISIGLSQSIPEVSQPKVDAEKPKNMPSPKDSLFGRQRSFCLAGRPASTGSTAENSTQSARDLSSYMNAMMAHKPPAKKHSCTSPTSGVLAPTFSSAARIRLNAAHNSDTTFDSGRYPSLYNMMYEKSQRARSAQRAQQSSSAEGGPPLSFSVAAAAASLNSASVNGNTSSISTSLDPHLSLLRASGTQSRIVPTHFKRAPSPTPHFNRGTLGKPRWRV